MFVKLPNFTFQHETESENSFKGGNQGSVAMVMHLLQNNHFGGWGGNKTKLDKVNGAKV